MRRSVISLYLVLHLLFSAHAQSENDRSAAVDSLFREYDIQSTAGVSVMVIKDSRIIYVRSFGLADVAYKVPATPHTNYRLASLSKPFTAMAVMILRDEGRLSLDDHLDKFFPKVRPYGDQITIRQMMDHTAGLPNYGDLIPSGTTQPLTDKDVLHLVEQQDTAVFKPGQRFEYSNTIEEMFTIRSWENDHMAYGYGWYIDKKFGQKRVSHSGGTSGFSTYMIRYPAMKFSIIILSNIDEGFTVGKVGNEIEDIYLKRR